MTVPELAYFIGSPRRRFVDSEWDAYMERWMYFSCPPNGIRLSYPGDKCDVARSIHIGAAKGELPLDDVGLGFSGSVKLPSPPAVTIQFDDDVWPRMAGTEMIRLIHQDFDDGYDVVTAPTVNNENYTAMVWTKDAKMPSDRCVEVSYSAFGFVAFSPHFIQEVQPIYDELFWPGTPKSRKVPMYCCFGQNTDDSMSFSETVTKQGFKLGCDGRLLVTHRKAVELDPQTAQWHKALGAIANAKRPDLYLRTLRIIDRELAKMKEGAEEEEERGQDAGEPAAIYDPTE